MATRHGGVRSHGAGNEAATAVSTRMMIIACNRKRSTASGIAVEDAGKTHRRQTMKHPSPSAVGMGIAAAVLSGCVQTPIAVEPPASSADPVLCVNRSQCDVYWQRAQAWVANNSVYRLQTVTDTVLETAGPQAARTGLAYRITRVPDNQDGARIYVMAACGNAVACNPAPSDAVVAFKRFVVN